MRSAADARDDGSSASTSCVVDSLLENETKHTVGVNNCVNISSNALDDTRHHDNDFLLSDRSFVDPSPIYECIASELDEPTTSYDAAFTRKIEEDILNKFLFNNDDDTLTSSKYSDVTSRCEPSTSSTPASDSSVVMPAPYASTRDNNHNHRKAVRKNFSLWIGVTSCVWGLLLLLMKNYVD